MLIWFDFWWVIMMMMAIKMNDVDMDVWEEGGNGRRDLPCLDGRIQHQLWRVGGRLQPILLTC